MFTGTLESQSSEGVQEAKPAVPETPSTPAKEKGTGQAYNEKFYA